MNGINYLIDTNAVIYFISGNKCMEKYKSSNFAFSVISYMELLSYADITEYEEESIRGFLGNSESIFITTEIMEKTIQIRKKYKMKLPDAIIAASAIVNDISLITADQEFRKINELKLELL